MSTSYDPMHQFGDIYGFVESSVALPLYFDRGQRAGLCHVYLFPDALSLGKQSLSIFVAAQEYYVALSLRIFTQRNTHDGSSRNYSAAREPGQSSCSATGSRESAGALH